MSRRNIILILIYFVLLFLSAWSLHTHNAGIHYWSKPLIITTLMLLVYWYRNDTKFIHLILAALFFGTLGDIFLMFDHKAIMFTIGLASFLVGHIFYIVAFSKYSVTNWPIRSIFGAIALGFYSLVLYSHLPNDMKIPVFVYISVLTTMSIKAFELKPFNLFLALGAFLFVFSDACIAVNRFVFPIPYEAYVIMLTYGLAQFFIVKGFLSRTN